LRIKPWPEGRGTGSLGQVVISFAPNRGKTDRAAQKPANFTRLSDESDADI